MVVFCPYRVLLRALVNRYEKIEKRVEKKLLQETICAFSITNEELSTHGKSGGDGYRTCVTTCKVSQITSTPQQPGYFANYTNR